MQIRKSSRLHFLGIGEEGGTAGELVSAGELREEENLNRWSCGLFRSRDFDNRWKGCEGRQFGEVWRKGRQTSGLK